MGSKTNTRRAEKLVVYSMKNEVEEGATDVKLLVAVSHYGEKASL